MVIALNLWPIPLTLLGFAAYILLLRATMSAPKPRGPLADPCIHVHIVKPAFSNAEIAIIHTSTEDTCTPTPH